MSRIFNAFYFAVIPSEVEGARGVSFKDAFRDPSTFARDDGLPHLHRHFISAEQAPPKMVPGEIFHYPRETDGADIVAPEFLQVRFRFFMDRTEQPQFGPFQIQPMPRFEQMVNSFALDQGAGKNCAKDWRT